MNEKSILHKTFEELQTLSLRQNKHIERLEKQIESYEKQLKKLELTIENHKKKELEFLEIQGNADRYSSYKLFLEEKRISIGYKELYESSDKRNNEIIAELQKRLKNTQNTTIERAYNERGAGRKARYDIKIVQQIIVDNRDKSLRVLQELCLAIGQSISLEKIRQLRGNND